MRKALSFIFSLIICSNLAIPDLIEVYKKGIIKLTADPNFGKGTEWESLFYDTYKSMTIIEDGTIFVSNSRNHNIFKFNSSGELAGTYGKQGLGPGDLSSPGHLSILDGRYLVIDEYSLLRRISVFDFFGKCIRVLKTDHSASFSTALKDNKIAYIYTDTSAMLKSGKLKHSVYIKDIASGGEYPVISCELPEKNFVMIDGMMVSIGSISPKGNLILNRTLDGNLVVGISNNPDIRIYSPEGKLLRSFQLKLKPIPVTDDYIKKSKDLFLSELKTGGTKYNSELVKKFEKLSFKEYSQPFFPLYNEILVDAEGNFLIFKSSECLENCNEVFQVYSPGGEYICETTIDKGDFDFTIGGTFQNIVFSKDAIYGLFQLKNSEDVSLRLVRVVLK